MNKIAKHRLLILFFSSFLWIISEDGSYAQNASTFMRTVNAPGMNGGLSLAETSDDGFIGTGQQEAGSAGSCDVYVYKVDGCGNPEWYKNYGGGGDDGGADIQQTSDGGYIVTGLMASFGQGGYDICFRKQERDSCICKIGFELRTCYSI
jgi:hypothetical protein